MTRLDARPQPLAFDPKRSALVINDMQNAFCSPGGYIDRIGFDLSRVPAVVEKIRSLRDMARAAGMPVVFLQNGFSADLREAPGPETPLWHKSNALRYMRATPAEQGRILVHGTWDYDFIEVLRPSNDEIIISKHIDNGFTGTRLDHLLRARDVRTLFVCGISSNVGVESTLRSAYHAGYFGVMVSDACMAVGPSYMQAATEFNIETFFGWVSKVESVQAALAPPA
ncbi:MAG: isochorismatase family protein [Pigmentiphaga sp.]|uniref:isochorismatase family protein n=1 Tax=Pigmentiphaga sp. TaxID=1977564 RepID=UPI0029BC60B1|nr:isochorismatase family protein [Pigmentiphaga sp.]MDX3904650.1 isochorismatase family protein [Pigmentiphaga sp.]